MHGRLALVSLLLLSATLAGCTDEGQIIPLSDVAVVPDSDSLDAGPIPSEEEEDVGPVDEEPADTETAKEPPSGIPVPSLDIAASGSFAPLPVNITIDATDDEEDLVSWVLLIGESDFNGTEFPSVVSHTFDEPGTYTIVLTVLDAANQTANITKDIIVELKVFPYTETLLNSILCGGCSELGSSDFCVGLVLDMNEQDCVFFELPAGAAGHEFKVSSSIGDPDVEFRTECNFEAGYGPVHGAAGEEAGVIPEGMGCIVAWEWEDFDSLITLLVT